MAISHRATSAVVTGTGTSIALNAPAGVQTGDLLLLCISVNGVRTVSSGLGAWTVVSNISNGNGNFGCITYRRIADGTADDTPTVTINLSATFSGIIVAYQGVDTTDPFDEKADTSQNTVDSTFEIGTITVDDDDSMGVIVIASNTTGSMTWPSGYASRAEVGTTAEINVADNFNVDTGTHTPGNVTAGSANRFAATIMAFKAGIVNSPPVITSDGGGATATIHVDEGDTAITTVVATGTPTPTFSITGGANSADYSIDTNTGVLTRDSAIDYVAPEVVEVTATNSEGTDVQTITVVPTPIYSGVAPSAPLNDAEYFFRPVADHVAGNTQYANLGTTSHPLILGTDYTTEADEDPNWVSDGTLGNHLRWLITPPTYAKAFIPEALIDQPSGTFAIRIRPQATSGDYACFNVMQANGTDKVWYLHASAGNHWYGRIWDATQSQVVAEGTTTVNTTTTYNVVLTWDEATTTLRLYVNGTEEAETIHTEGRILVGEDSYLEFPRYPQGLEQDAMVFRMAFWDRALSGAEVTALETNTAWTSDAAIGAGNRRRRAIICGAAV